MMLVDLMLFGNGPLIVGALKGQSKIYCIASIAYAAMNRGEPILF